MRRMRKRRRPPVTPVLAFLTVGDLAARWRVDRSTVYRWLDTGTLRGIRLGDHERAPVRVPVHEAERFERDTLGASAAPSAARDANPPPKEAA
jgi:excisionase family DNA binding protein